MSEKFKKSTTHFEVTQKCDANTYLDHKEDEPEDQFI